ncbi:peroxiredoxin [Hahella sp. CCB-MM4]|uniref:peroxiredoxin n=1 Tax=Hahella sp. (strain CCB-MM4) TaxID=1926491 RepID=UPI000B9A93E2|nr:peroxiredoxin [Hahella sp. CCB-MM4]OZG72118.1 peroxiredoxin [Hahella sp. CCB-MM4]
MIELNKQIPEFSVTATPDQTVSSGDLLGRNVVIYFYPKDNTPGCTTEGQDFRDHHEEFTKLNTVIFGVSKDSLKTHQNFKAKHSFPFELITDPDEELCKLFDVIKLKKLYGKEYMGIERSTFLIDSSGKLAKEWRKVKVKGHVAEVLEAARQL